MQPNPPFAFEALVKRNIVLLAGMPRAGTSWVYHLISALWQAAGGDDALDLRRRYHLERWMSPGDALIRPVLPDLGFVLLPWVCGHSFVVKTHGWPTNYPRRLVSRRLFFGLMNTGRMKVVGLYRDPRDALLSAWEYGKHGHPKSMAARAFRRSVPDIPSGIPWMLDRVRDAVRWRQHPLILTLRYEDLRYDFATQIDRLLAFLDLHLAPEVVQSVLASYQPGKPSGGMHFNKGVTGRFRDVLTPEEIALCNRAFGPYLPLLGYEE